MCEQLWCLVFPPALGWGWERGSAPLCQGLGQGRAGDGRTWGCSGIKRLLEFLSLPVSLESSQGPQCQRVDEHL